MSDSASTPPAANGAASPSSSAPASFTGRPWPAMSIAQAERLLTAPGARFELEERDVQGVRTRVWKNGPRTLRDVFLGAYAQAAGPSPEPPDTFHARTLLVYEDERVTFAAFQRAVLALAQR